MRSRKQTPGRVAKASSTTIQGEPPTPVQKRAEICCRHCGRVRFAGVLLCEGCGSPWPKLRGK